MKKTFKLKKNYEFRNTIKKGIYVAGNNIECFYLKNNKKYNYIGIAISSKICNAVNRNRIKRIIREAYKTLETDITAGNTFVFLWKKKINIENCTFDNILSDMKIIFNKVGILNEEHID